MAVDMAPEDRLRIEQPSFKLESEKKARRDAQLRATAPASGSQRPEGKSSMERGYRGAHQQVQPDMVMLAQAATAQYRHHALPPSTA